MTQKTKKMLRWIPSVLISLQLGSSALMKFTANPFMVQNFAKAHLLPYMNIIGCMELLFLLLFLQNRTMRIAILLITGYFGGAMAIEAIYGNIFIPATILTVVWLAAWLREPAMFKTRNQTSIFNPLNPGIGIL